MERERSSFVGCGKRRVANVDFLVVFLREMILRGGDPLVANFQKTRRSCEEEMKCSFSTKNLKHRW
jgi:hypothetical protein